MEVAVIGAGAAGLTASWLLKRRGHSPIVFESTDEVGGRAKTVRFARDHHFDWGCARLASSYRETLALISALGMREALIEEDVRSKAYLSENGRLTKLPAAETTPLLPFAPPKERIKGLLWMAGLYARRRTVVGRDGRDLRFDNISGEAHLAAGVGSTTASVLSRTFESRLYSPLSETSAAILRYMWRMLTSSRFYAISDGMDTLWKAVASQLEVVTSSPLRHLRVTPGGRVELSFDGSKSRRFDACIVAAPVTRVRSLLEGVDLPSWVESVRYAPHVCLYAAREGSTNRADVYAAEPDDEAVVVSRAADGWLRGRLPPRHAAAVVSASSEMSAYLIDSSDDKIEKTLWEHGSRADPDLFGLDKCHVVQVFKWPEAVPVFTPGLLTRIVSWQQRPPVVFAGDWLHSPCIEGAVRSALGAVATIERGGS